jgi:hypothetical protein
MRRCINEGQKHGDSLAGEKLYSEMPIISIAKKYGLAESTITELKNRFGITTIHKRNKTI